MNAPVTTRAAEGWDRLSWTVADVLRMQDVGIIDDEWSFELWEGEIVPHERQAQSTRDMEAVSWCASLRGLYPTTSSSASSLRCFSGCGPSWSPT